MMERKGRVWAGVVGLRAPDGSIARTVKIYRDVDVEPKPGRMTKDEERVCDGIIRDMAVMYHKYVERLTEEEQPK
ncbi:hypothetical protein C814_00831 [Anaerotruncus sp. G3(2012)]|uniref:hypothetical protein n=2 Tax=Bacteria TaxID=2 RepID=UPI00033D9BF9|nr:hypothetical protein [Anaerotruncus sp. G3(2012)]EOS54438.1 hypothetical protein C814_03419 [Anaerotruncus sp. G3(2012)]EOS63357.1 hypothetical protein C814_00831 [Anaerotruncus sp. G3(2012)]